ANGHLSVVEWLHHNRREGCTVSAMNWAAEEGHLSVVKWLHRNRWCTTAAFDRAAMNNHVEVIMWLTRNRSEGGTESALQWAVSRGHTNVGDFRRTSFYTQNFNCSKYSMDKAAQGGHVEVLQLLHDQVI
ncbi:unnamed protein product, partial [Hapterophycus canaliculatus]